jgi:NitT/TauT family transport system permease protein
MSAPTRSGAEAGSAARREERTLEAARAATRRENGLRRRDLALSVLTPVVLLLLWELAARSGGIDARFFPPPTEIVAGGAEMVRSGELWTHTSATLRRLLVGGGLGAVLGVVTGLLMGSSRALNAAVGPLFSALYPLPKIAIYPLLMMIFGGTSDLPKILSVFITVFFIMQISTVSGVWSIDRKLIEAGSAYGAKGIAMFRHVVLPGALPFVFTGLKTATGSAVVVVTAVEFTGSAEGLGYVIWNSWQLFMPEKMYVGLVTIGIIGAVLTFLLQYLERVVLPWRRKS